MQDLDLKRIFSGNLKRHRISKKITQSDLSFEIGISPRHYQRVENGEKIPSVIIAYKLAKALDISIDALFEY